MIELVESTASDKKRQTRSLVDSMSSFQTKYKTSRGKVHLSYNQSTRGVEGPNSRQDLNQITLTQSLLVIGIVILINYPLIGIVSLGYVTRLAETLGLGGAKATNDRRYLL